MDRRQYDEKEEKEPRKQEEKTEEKSAEEKSFEEKYRRDPLGTVMFALILIWAGLVFLAEELGLLEALRVGLEPFPFLFFPFISATVWALIFAGIGVLLVIEVLIRLLVPAYRRSVTGTLIAAAVMFGLAFGGWSLILPVVLVAIGLTLLLGGLFRRRE